MLTGGPSYWFHAIGGLPRPRPALPGPTDVEQVFLSEARGRILAEDVMSLTALPPWDNSAMDGYAIRARDVAGASETSPVAEASTAEELPPGCSRPCFRREVGELQY